MTRFFVSYARADTDAVRSLVSALEFLNHEAWIDRRLAGGQKWWDEILEEIRGCDVFVVALSNNGLRSNVCRVEYDYATALGKTILPVIIEDVSSDDVPPALAAVQFVDYRLPNEQAALALARALQSLPASRPLPVPLPDPPMLAPSLTRDFDAGPDMTRFVPDAVSAPLKAITWTLVVVLVIFPAALLASSLLMAIVQTVFLAEGSEISPGWTIAVMVVIGWPLWRYVSSRFDRVAVWLAAKRGRHPRG
jgi:hypothetical protein